MATCLRLPMASSIPCSSSSSMRLKHRSFNMRCAAYSSGSSQFPMPHINPKDPFLSKLAYVAKNNPDALFSRPKNSDTPPLLDIYNSPNLMATPAEVEKSESYNVDIDDDPPPDLPSMLLHGRIVYIGMPLVAEVTELVVAQLLYLQYMDPKEPIYLYINSTGTTRDDGEAVGMESEGFAIYDSLMQLENEVHTVGVGAAIGQACLLLAAGTKGKRFMMPHAKAMIQQPRAPSGGLMQASDVAIRAREVLINRDTLVKLLAEHTENSEEMVANAMRRPYYMDATKAKEFGVIDKILWPDQEDVKIIADVADAL